VVLVLVRVCCTVGVGGSLKGSGPLVQETFEIVHDRLFLSEGVARVLFEFEKGILQCGP